MHWRQSHWFLSRTPLKTRVKPQKFLFNRVAGQETQTQMFSCGVCKVFRDWCLRTTASETCCFTWSVLKLAQIGTWLSLREKYPGMKFFLVRIFRSWTEYREIRSIESECGKIRTRKNPVSGNFSRSILYYNLQFRLPILT